MQITYNQDYHNGITQISHNPNKAIAMNHIANTPSSYNEKSDSHRWQWIHKPFFTDYRVLLISWIGVGLFVAIKGTLTHSLHNNYQIYKYVFWHLIEKLPLYPPYPAVYHDVNNYGPLFGLIIAPFALLPDWIGAPLWETFLILTLFFAIRQLPLKQWQHAAIYWFCINSLFTSATNVQFNITIAAIIVLSYTSLKKEKEPWAALFIIVGTLVKIYGLVGLAFFFFSKHKLRFIGWLIVWSAVLFALPMLVSSPTYIIGQYSAWVHELVFKNSENTVSMMQDMSIMGMIRKSTGHLEWPNFPMIAVGIVLFLLPYLQIKRYQQTGFQLLVLASVLLFTVLFSTGTEPNTFIIGMVGVAIWFVIQPRPYKKWQWAVLAFVFLFTSMPPSDLFPAYLRNNFMIPYALLAVPCAVAWLIIIFENSHRSRKPYQLKETT